MGWVEKNPNQPTWIELNPWVGQNYFLIEHYNYK